MRRLGRPRTAADRELGGAFAYGGGLVLAALVAYGFNAAMGRRLSPTDFGTFAALLAVLLALSGPTTALLGGAAMSAARSGRIALPPWRGWILLGGITSGVLGLLPLPTMARSAAWLVFGCAMWMLVSWNRGLLIGTGRPGLVGGTMILDGMARLSIALLLLARGWGVTGATAGLALGIGSSFVLTQLLLPADRIRERRPLSPEVWAAVVGLFFLTVAQFPDVVAVRVGAARQAGAYAAASSIARIALYAQAAAAAYALRRAAVAGARQALARTLLLSAAPGLVAIVVLEAFPRRLLAITYGGRYLEATWLVRVLAPALGMAGLAFVLVSLMMGAGRIGWAWSVALAAPAGTAVVFALGSAPHAVALAMLALQACLLGLVVLHVVRVLDADRGKEGIIFLTWRDTRHPQAGGSEVYVEEMARRMARSGRKVTVFCAAHPHAPPTDVVDGVRFVRRGSWRTVYAWAALYHLTGRFGSHDVVVDVQNGISFFSPLYCGRRVVALVHHVHREQWGIVFGPRLARAGWWVESRVAPVVHRRSRYVAVSNSTRDELVSLGVDPGHISVVRNGSIRGGRSEPVPKAGRPTLVYLGRLVPHKRIDLLLDAAARLVSDFPALQVDVIGRGMWEQHLRSKAERLGLGSRVRFHGFVEEAHKQRLLGEAWVLAQPSVKEGWGLSVVEAAAAGTPAVAFGVGGLRESVLDGETGILADSFDEFTEGLRRLLRSPDLRDRMGQAARSRAATFTWDAAAETFLEVLTSAQRPPELAVEPQPVVAAQPAAI